MILSSSDFTCLFDALRLSRSASDRNHYICDMLPSLLGQARWYLTLDPDTSVGWIHGTSHTYYRGQVLFDVASACHALWALRISILKTSGIVNVQDFNFSGIK